MKRRVKSCDNCKYWQGFPHVHCDLGCKIRNEVSANVYKTFNVYRTFPVDFEDCVKRRTNEDKGDKKKETRNTKIDRTTIG